jgi:hypothetical protein
MVRIVNLTGIVHRSRAAVDRMSRPGEPNGRTTTPPDDRAFPTPGARPPCAVTR